MASRFWVPVAGSATGTWDGTATAHWSATSGGAGGASAPTTADDVFFDALSGSGSVAVTGGGLANCRSFVCTGASGITFTGGTTIQTWGPTITLSPGVTVSSVILGVYQLAGSVALTSAGRLISSVTIGSTGTGSASTLVLQDAMALVGTFTLALGGFDTGGFSVSAAGFSSSNANARTLTLRSSAITISGANATAWLTTTATGLTVTPNTATVTFTGANAGFASATVDWQGMSVSFTGSGSAQWNGGGAILANLTRIGTAAKTDVLLTTAATGLTITGTLTLTGNSAVNRLGLGSNVLGSQRAITAANVVASNVDIGDIAASGAANWNLSAITGGSGDTGGNSGITFTASIAQSSNILAAGTNWSNLALWPVRMPLPQDDVTFRGFSAGGQVIGIDVPRLGRNVSISAAIVSLNVTTSVYGNFAWGSNSNTFWTGTPTNSLSLRGRGSHTISNLTAAMAAHLDVNAIVGTYTLLSAVNTAGNFTVNSGNFVANGFNVTCATFASNNTVARSIDMGTGTWALTSTAAGTPWNIPTATGLTLTAASSTIAITTASANARTFQSSGGQTYGTLTYTVAGSTGSLTLNGSSTFAAINFSDATNARTLLISTNNTMVFGAWHVNGSAGKLVTVQTPTTGVAASVQVAAGATTPFQSDYLSLRDINAKDAAAAVGTGLWFAGENSVNVSGNTGWVFGRYAHGGGTLSSAPTLTGTGRKRADAAGTLTAAPTLAGSGRAARHAAGALSSAPTLAGAGRKSDHGGGALTSAPTLAGSGVSERDGTLAADLTVVFTGSGHGTGRGQLVVLADLSGSGRARHRGSNVIHGTVTLTGTGVARRHRAGSLTSAVTLTGRGRAARHSDGTLTSAPRLTGRGHARRHGAAVYVTPLVTLDGTGEKRAHDLGYLTGFPTFTGGGHRTSRGGSELTAAPAPPGALVGVSSARPGTLDVEPSTAGRLTAAGTTRRGTMTAAPARRGTLSGGTE